MRSSISILAFIALFAVSIGAQTKHSNRARLLRSETEVRAVIQSWADAVRDRDTNALKRIFADDIVITSFDGSVRGKSEEIEILKPNASIVTESVTNEDINLKIFGDVAIVTALTKINFIVQSKPQPFSMRYTAVFVKRKGRWQLTALQSVVPKKPQR